MNGYPIVTKRKTIANMQALAKEMGGRCLSERYENIDIKLKWQCKAGHIFNLSPSKVKHRKQWCPQCNPIITYTINDMKELAKNRGGQCLSNTYVNSRVNLTWQCSEGHSWEATANNVIKGTWCKKCAGLEKGSIEDMQYIAESRGGKCLSTHYTSNHSKLTWQCSAIHIWEAVPSSVKGGTWCPVCSGRMRLTLQEMQSLASARGGICLSTEYKDARTPLKWRCADGHEWEAMPDHVKNTGQWCPTCSSSIGINELICKYIFETIFKMPFDKKRPKWLINPETGKCMELDGYCMKLHLAFEYQGAQHYEENSYFHLDGAISLEIRKRMDETKRGLCKQHGIILIEIPYLVNKDSLLNFIIDELNSHSIKTPTIPLELYDLKNYQKFFKRSKLKEMQDIAKDRGGECLSVVYLDAHTKIKWRCSDGHEWATTSNNIKNGTW